ncbi:hypothetical protein, unlikely [Trypanosoma congolense IL3000]|uniref:Uncharacterized protein n=1 Tax=Trypanosoma congolense (strain IL3000) TaxID=1068625 RepID=F9WGE8_TRYCI|nr:hypothetical protein, unlikely [Trypanosoma congolense IL3000]
MKGGAESSLNPAPARGGESLAELSLCQSLRSFPLVMLKRFVNYEKRNYLLYHLPLTKLNLCKDGRLLSHTPRKKKGAEARGLSITQGDLSGSREEAPCAWCRQQSVLQNVGEILACSKPPKFGVVARNSGIPTKRGQYYLFYLFE